ncbi:S-adenosyl-L-methionine-dependent methyltransferase [Lenzites betulinus]|nr:S-adenosyl-L-methionine-dependent methyltransferase [Lenzites betulinus]
MPEQSLTAQAQELLRLVETIQSTTGSATAGSDAHEIFAARQRVQKLTATIMREVCGPLEYTILLAESCQESAALHLVTEYSVADVIGDGSKTLAEICEEVKVNFRYMDIAMKCLLSHGYFEEVGGFDSKLFKNNAMSDVLRAGHPQTLKAAIGFICDDGGKAAAHLVEAARTRTTTTEIPTPALNLAFGFEGPVFQHWNDASNAWRADRMGLAMKQVHQMANGNVVTDFDWPSLPSPVIDVGGGIGTLELAILKLYPEAPVRFIVVDLAETCKSAETVWKTQPASSRSRVTFMEGDFFAPTLEATRLPCGQPTYLLRHVLHDWTDDEVVTILRNVRAAMVAPPPASHGVAATPKLLVCDIMLSSDSGRFTYTTSMQLLTLNNGVVRSQEEMNALLKKAGFKVVVTHAMRAADTIIEAVPSND